MFNPVTTVGSAGTDPNPSKESRSDDVVRPPRNKTTLQGTRKM